jgi:deoxyribodipyrimidine photolyase-related protein
MTKEISLIFPHQLFELHPAMDKNRDVFLIEDHLYFTQLAFHKLKLMLHRASMKCYADVLSENGLQVNYIEVQAHESLKHLFEQWGKAGVEVVHYVDSTDFWLEKRIRENAIAQGMKAFRYENPNFITPRAELKEMIPGTKKRNYFMASFYTQQRKKLNILVDDQMQPVGGKWSFDVDNRKKVPKGLELPEIYKPEENEYVKEARAYIEKHFPNHFGQAENFIYPTNFEQAQQALDNFLMHRMQLFGDYEDAIVAKESFLFHSLLTPALNIGLLSPQQVVDRTLELHAQHDFPLNCLEGFIRQIIGWREFMRGIYELEGVFERTNNHYGFTRKIPRAFWTGETGIPPIDQTIQKIDQYAYAHHIERLMVLGNFMHLCEFDPKEVYRWFMEVFIDAYDWVMVPNVYGMSQYADGGLITTKPYISGSSYIRKMSDYKKGDWCEIWDALYWRYMHVHQEQLAKNHRMSMMVAMVRKMKPEKLAKHLEVAEEYLANLD